ncbi:PREDICTED: uncharacterized protein LOC105458239 [Wasmannia auropunctata]|uniref:uncharacterized protein LOC105458239 n=1 Tax=Wasmannia auropunctata TaxID=64793 RepID=UPI0005EFDDED|nr:PREDICTED: uncharacterized protein LOC105458239 [Wasmannia auropunctata]XP_011701704.1 PREDICTED: uncharacterized protein LOC105458239 [Wasmannia auropunctata]XP_011701705.1 PREDICTED: uncharacterized protein LOC105458239 [Wasmannia auropunctata]XP_011701706.1 PREDICTED: uncharacterized protein LOC105458239 [Wasmannia auropunctata]
MDFLSSMGESGSRLKCKLVVPHDPRIARFLPLKGALRVDRPVVKADGNNGSVNVALPAGLQRYVGLARDLCPVRLIPKAAPERISFAPLRHGRYFNRDTFVLAPHAEKLDFKA